MSRPFIDRELQLALRSVRMTIIFFVIVAVVVGFFIMLVLVSGRFNSSRSGEHIAFHFSGMPKNLSMGVPPERKKHVRARTEGATRAHSSLRSSSSIAAHASMPAASKEADRGSLAALAVTFADPSAAVPVHCG